MRVAIYLNEATRRERWLDGYAEGDQMRKAIEFDLDVGWFGSAVADWAFHQFNVAHEHLFDRTHEHLATAPCAWGDRLALAYRFAGNRSLSIGDIVVVEGVRYACAPDGWVVV